MLRQALRGGEFVSPIGGLCSEGLPCKPEQMAVVFKLERCGWFLCPRIYGLGLLNCRIRGLQPLPDAFILPVEPAKKVNFIPSPYVFAPRGPRFGADCTPSGSSELVLVLLRPGPLSEVL